MLTELRVRNLAVIADVTVPLGPGLNVLTGETGAGKTLLIDALALLLGERASTDRVRPGAGRATVEAAFDLAAYDSVVPVADQAGIDVEEGRMVVKREINVEGRNRAWANGSPTTIATLATLGSYLVDLHGQHEAQSLLKQAAQRDILDAFGGAGSARERVRLAHETASELRAREEDLASRIDDVKRRADYLRHVVKEIEVAQPKPGEDEVLAAEAKRLANVEELTRLAEQLAALIDGDEGSSLESVAAAVKTLDQLEKIDKNVQQWRGSLDTAYAEIEEVARAVRDYVSEIDVDPARLEAVEARRDLLYRLQQKYGPTLQDVVNTGEEASRELDLLDTADLDLSSLSQQRAQADTELKGAADRLTKKRRQAVEQLSRRVNGILPGLGMPGGTFSVDITPTDSVTSTGGDMISFLVKLNVGMDARPLAQVASGGELSRLMLALKVVLAEHDSIPTLVFDEVDQGVGGEVSAQIAEYLARVAETRQVLVITHVPQIAARAQQHLHVEKHSKAGIATAAVETLSPEERVDEVARMLGDRADTVARQHAAEMLRREGTGEQLAASG